MLKQNCDLSYLFSHSVKWNYNEFSSITPNLKAQGNNEFVINIKKGKKADTMKFSSDHRADILTECLRYSSLFCDKFASNKVLIENKFVANKLVF